MVKKKESMKIEEESEPSSSSKTNPLVKTKKYRLEAKI